MITLLLDAFRAAVRALATWLLDWAAPPPAPWLPGYPLRVVPEALGYCGTRQHPDRRAGRVGYLCTQLAGHVGGHAAYLDGELLHTWGDVS